jgi:serine/threonine-protein kinase
MVETIDRYHLVARIGRGGMAEVFRAKLASIGGYERDVALKVLLPNFAAEPEFVEMLLDEARIAGAIDHPNVLQVLDVGRTGGIFYLVMEYVDGKDLRSIAKQVPGGRLPLGMSLYVIYEMLRGLQAVHAAVDERGVPRKIVHRDISPGNVLVDRRGFVKLGDFGIARASGRITRTRVGAVKGKSRYMAPEQLGPSVVDHRADLYAAGVTLFEAIFGDFARESSTPSIYGPMFTWPERLPKGVVTPDVEAILRRAIAQNPNDRYASANEMRADLEVAMQRAAPGYGPDLLARELRRLLTGSTKSIPIAIGTRPRTATPEPGIALRPVHWRGAATAQHSLPALDLDAHSGTPLQLDGLDLASESTPTLSSIPTGNVPPPIPHGLRRGVADEIHSLPSELLSSDSPVQRILRFIDSRVRGLFRRRRPGAGLLITALALLTVGIAVAVAATGGGPAADLPHPEAVAPRQPEPPHAVPLPAFGTIDVTGPAGAIVQIDGNLYPSAPTKIELPPGDYTVRIYAGQHHATTSRVHVVAGHLTSL